MLNLECSSLSGGEADKPRSLATICGGAPTVLEFWTTTCKRCPEALSPLDRAAASVAGADAGADADGTSTPVRFVAINLDDRGAAAAIVGKAAAVTAASTHAPGCDGAAAPVNSSSAGGGSGRRVRHYCVDAENRARAKAQLDINSVPFTVVLGKDGTVMAAGGPGAVDVSKAARLLADPVGAANAVSAAAVGAATASNGEQPGAAVAPVRRSERCLGELCPLVRPTKPETLAKPAGGVIGGTAVVPSGSMAPDDSCEGGVCKLMRRPKPSAAAAAPPSSPPPAAPVPVPQQPAAAPAAAAAAAGGAASASAPKVVCDGDVCRLVRRPKPAAAAAASAPALSVAPASAAPAAAAAPLQPINSAAAVVASNAPQVVCEGDVCKLVRPKPAAAATATALPAAVPAAAAAAAAAATGQENVAPERAHGTPPAPVLGVGDIMPGVAVVDVATGTAVDWSSVAPDGRTLVLDFWTTRCTRCPAALDKLEERASCAAAAAITATGGSGADGATGGGGSVVYVSLNLDSLEGARAIIGRGRWPHVRHLFVAAAGKAQLQQRLGIDFVPFYVVADDRGVIQQVGGPKRVDLSLLDGGSGGDDVTAAVTTAFVETAAVATVAVATVALPMAAVAPLAVTIAAATAFSMDEDF